nr:helix-turn-helix domain-containing protein [Candidatus Contendobacter sp.]
MPETLLWSIPETAAQLGKVSPRTVRRLIERGELAVVRVGRCVRIPADAARNWVQNQLSARPAREKLTCPSTSEAKPTGWTLPSPTASDYANLLGLATAATPSSSTTKSKP